MPQFFTEYKFDPAYVAAQVEQKSAGLKANLGYSNLLGYGLGVVANRLKKNPKRYRDYGPYWWALKALLRDTGVLDGKQTDPLVEAEYRYEMPVQTLIAADLFRDDYLKRYFVGSNEFVLNSSQPEIYVLFDPDMEQML